MTVSRLKVSPRQLQLLEKAENSEDPMEVAEALHVIFSSEDIRQEKEDAHPRWKELFDIYAEELEEIYGSTFFNEIQAFVANISKWDAGVTTLDPASQRIVFVLGAGASKPSPSGIPTVKELLPQLLERGRRLDREDVNSLAEFCVRSRIDNIEDLLTAAQLATFCSRSPSVLQLLNYLLYRRTSGPYEPQSTWPPRPRRVRSPYADVSSVAFLQDTLQVLFGLLASTMLPAKPNHAHEAIAGYAKEHPECAIVTTNYDCCMDLALEDKKLAFDYRVRFRNERAQGASSATPLIKLHGSLNWYYCETCQEVHHVDTKKLVDNYAKDEVPYTVIGICKDCGGQRRGLLVPPLAMKFDVAPPLTPLLDQAKRYFDEADLIAVIGFSFAEADVYISRMLSKSMQVKDKQRLLILDPESSVVTRVRSKLQASIPNFDESRVLGIQGDCALLLPQFLAGEMLETQPAGSPAEEGSTSRKPSRGSNDGKNDVVRSTG